MTHFFPLQRLLALLLIPCLLLLGAGPAVAFGIGEERLIGEKILYSVRRDLRILDDPDISQYVNSLGQKVLAVVGPQYFDYRFFVVQSDQFNAFAAPAGLVFLYSGLIEAMHSEDQLVSVLAHEIGHVASRHIAQRLEKSGKIGAASLLLGLAGLALGVPALSQGIFTGSIAAGQAINLRYSREDEEQADRLSFEWMQRMQRDPQALREMLKTMRRIGRYRAGDIPQYLLTHPNPEARLSYVESLLEGKTAANQSAIQPQAFEFLRFKYRVLVESSNHARLRQYCQHNLTAGANADERQMAGYGLALLESANHRLDQALDLLATVQAQYPAKEILAVDRAAMLLTAGRRAEARGELEQALRRDEGDLYALFHLARVEQESGNSPRAEALLHQVAKAMPEYPQVYFQLGKLEADRGRPGSSLFYLGKYKLYLGQDEEARRHLRQAEKDETVPSRLREEAGRLLERLKRIEKET